ncbi:hypothetical protein TPE_2251 [Treponema pedis str. T A4]|uniref:Molybdopterin oxidoreductase n=1 Tax=Treponema pedis str. T A4 TaxID=1291379 RepID=S5ZWF9_9SPIR|nr:DUF1667 domain-containing protein [Treponema pedis]AGT44725.1 hypothetical protein TPE_2251 [Treponema pedis str. T A4]
MISEALQKKEFTCVSCPMGCRLTVYKNEKNEDIVEGYTCKRGIEYGLQEIKDPRRNISSTVMIEGSFLPSIPVKTSAPIPKGLIFNVMEKINGIKVKAPIKTGEIIIKNVLNTGSDIVAARTMEIKNLL